MHNFVQEFGLGLWDRVMGYGLGLLLQCGLNNAAATAILNYSDKLTSLHHSEMEQPGLLPN